MQTKYKFLFERKTTGPILCCENLFKPMYSCIQYSDLSKEEFIELLKQELNILMDPNGNVIVPTINDILKLNLYNNENGYPQKIHAYYESKYRFYTDLINALDNEDWFVNREVSRTYEVSADCVNYVIDELEKDPREFITITSHVIYESGDTPEDIELSTEEKQNGTEQ